ncbi:DinB family protein [Foetidibacter luteolus]|uniref:DinB family protein n=1 Tax=Foetidibacter luteolus TaxID=2608880 RepID=UPI00129BDF8E|nr:DinB family protein [Foetidibacter luteolus]
MGYCVQQYQMVQGARSALLSYCSSISQVHLNSVLPEFGNRSMAALLLHVADVYFGWLKEFALGQQVIPFAITADTNIHDITNAFEEVDALVAIFLEHFRHKEQEPVTGRLRNGNAYQATPFMLFTHVTTHEFHHKGQLLTMSRLLDYTPVDTDVIRF